MINLIPPHAKRVVVQEYWIRVFSVWFILIGIVATVAALLLLPSFVLIRVQLSALEEKVLQNNSEEESFKRAEEQVREANTLVSQLSETNAVIPSHRVITAINDAATNAIEAETFRVSRTNGTVDVINVQGTAASRDALADFKQALERSPLFETAVVPISDLAREVELPFAITITMRDDESE